MPCLLKLVVSVHIRNMPDSVHRFVPSSVRTAVIFPPPQRIHFILQEVFSHNQVPRLGRPHGPGFYPTSVHVRCMLRNMELGEVFLQILRFPPVSIIPSAFHTITSVIRHMRYITLETDSIA